MKNLKKSKFVLLEANYEPEVLRCCSYPYSVKQRIASNKGHLSNSEARKNYIKSFRKWSSKCNVRAFK